MNNKTYIIGFFTIFLLWGCKSESPTAEEEQINLLSRGWKAQTGVFATLDGDDVSINFSGFLLQFHNTKTFTSSNGNDPVWPGSGSWDFEINGNDKNLSKLVRDDGVVMTIHSLTATSLKISFIHQGADAGGRIKGVDGEFAFDLIAEEN